MYRELRKSYSCTLHPSILNIPSEHNVWSLCPLLLARTVRHQSTLPSQPPLTISTSLHLTCNRYTTPKHHCLPVSFCTFVLPTNTPATWLWTKSSSSRFPKNSVKHLPHGCARIHAQNNSLLNPLYSRHILPSVTYSAKLDITNNASLTIYWSSSGSASTPPVRTPFLLPCVTLIITKSSFSLSVLLTSVRHHLHSRIITYS